MKVLILILVMAAGIPVVPHLISDILVSKSDRYVSGLIINAIQQLKQDIVEGGYDPYYLDYAFGYYAIPVPLIFSTRALVKELNITGLSDMEVRHVDYYLNRMEFDLFMPRLEAKFRNAESGIVIFGSEISSLASGRIVFNEIRLAGEVRVGIYGGVSINQMNLDCIFQTIKSDIDFTIHGRNMSAQLNHFLEVIVVNTFEKFKEPVNELLAYYLIDYINSLLENN